MLKERHVAIIKQRVREILQELDYHDLVIRDDIFKLLRKKSKIIFYPLDEEPDLDGFHVVRYMKGEPSAFVYINSAKNYEKCIFCAAHELGHIYEIEKDVEQHFSEEKFSTKEIDDIMNRFAAELLMPHEEFKRMFRKILNNYCGNIDSLKNGELLKTIVALMDYFYVPYKAVVWRLWEIDFLTEQGKTKFENLEEENPDIINFCIYEGKYTRLRHPSRHKSFEDLPDFLSKAMEEGVLSNRKAKEIRDVFDIDIYESGFEKLNSNDAILLDTDILKENL